MKCDQVVDFPKSGHILDAMNDKVLPPWLNTLSGQGILPDANLPIYSADFRHYQVLSRFTMIPMIDLTTVHNSYSMATRDMTEMYAPSLRRCVPSGVVHIFQSYPL